MKRSYQIIFAGILSAVLAGAASAQDITEDSMAVAAPEENIDTAAAETAAVDSVKTDTVSRSYKKRTIITITEEGDDSSDVVIVRETKDTVYVVKKSDFSSTMKRTKHEVRTWRTKGFGLGGGPTPALHAINMSPVKELAGSIDPLRGKRFDYGPLDYRAFRMRGGLGYGGFGNGLRIGGGGSGGKTEIISNRYNGDSAIVLETHVGYGGFLVEKAFVYNRFNFNIGGFIGGGDIEVKVKSLDMGDIMWIDSDGDIAESQTLEANFMLLELHGGFTYTIVPIFHLGLDVTVPSFVSPNGFSSPGIPYSSEFFTVNPGFRARIIFGNLG